MEHVIITCKSCGNKHKLNLKNGHNLIDKAVRFNCKSCSSPIVFKIRKK